MLIYYVCIKNFWFFLNCTSFWRVQNELLRGYKLLLYVRVLRVERKWLYAKIEDLSDFNEIWTKIAYVNSSRSCFVRVISCHSGLVRRTERTWIRKRKNSAQRVINSRVLDRQYSARVIVRGKKTNDDRRKRVEAALYAITTKMSEAKSREIQKQKKMYTYFEFAYTLLCAFHSRRGIRSDGNEMGEG